MSEEYGHASRLKILSLEDSVQDFEIIREYLNDGGFHLDLTRVDSEHEFTAHLQQNKFDVILADFNLPGFNAFAALVLCNRICPEVPFICVSGAIGEETAIALLKQGAVDFVMKDKLEILSIAVTRAIKEAVEKAARKQAEGQAKMTSQILSLLNSSTSLIKTISHTLNFLLEETGIEAIGIRLKEGEGYPYISQHGFSDDFLSTENSLLSRNEEGQICRDKNGNPMLECTCGLVISGVSGGNNDLYTKGGSFWTNDASSLLSMTPALEKRFNPRSSCIKSGYSSIAIIPIRTEKEIVGVLQLNDSRKGLFTSEKIRFFESIGNIIGVALMRKQSNEELQASHQLLFKLSEQVPGVIYQYRLFPDGRSCFPYASSGMNLIYELTPEEVRKDATPVFERIYPDDRDSVSELIFESARNLSHFYCEFRVVLPRQGLKWRYCDAMPEKLDDNSTLWHGIIYDITELKNAELELNKKMNELQRFHNLTVDRELKMIELKKEVNELLKKSGQAEKYRIVD
jgi:CheY-like chemotaxis protein